MPVREVERVEVVVRRLDLAAVDDPVAEAEEDVLDLPADLRDQVEVAAPDAPRPGSVTSTDSSASRRSSSAPSSSASRAATAASSRLARGVQRHAGLAVAHLAQRLLQGALAAEVAGRGRSSSSRRRGSARNRVSGLGFQRSGRPSAERIIGPVTAPRSEYDAIARLYDAWSRSVTEDVVVLRRGGARVGGPVVELGVGTGRIAIPVARRRHPRDRRRHLAGDARGLPRARAEAAGVGDLGRPARGRPAPAAGRRSASRSSSRRSARSSTSGPTRSGWPRSAAVRELLEPGGRFVFDVFAPSREDIAETHGRWIEREPGIWERADWDERRGRADARACAARRARRTMALAWLPPGAGASCSRRPASR